MSGLLDAHATISDVRRSGNAATTGRMANDEVDLLRAVIVFTSSGLDASMKRLVNDVGRYLIGIPGTAARARFDHFIKQELRAPSVDENLQQAVVAADPATEILEYYPAARTKASFQGSGDLKVRVRNTLGIPSTKVSDAQLKGLDPFFMARNSIAHSMDYTNIHAPNSRARIHRGPTEVVGFVAQAFDVADLMHAAAEVVMSNR